MVSLGLLVRWKRMKPMKPAITDIGRSVLRSEVIGIANDGFTGNQ